MQKSRSNEFV